MFIAESLCCMDYGIIQHASVRMWLVCNADVYLPEPKCLTGERAFGLLGVVPGFWVEQCSVGIGSAVPRNGCSR